MNCEKLSSQTRWSFKQRFRHRREARFFSALFFWLYSRNVTHFGKYRRADRSRSLKSQSARTREREEERKREAKERRAVKHAYETRRMNLLRLTRVLFPEECLIATPTFFDLDRYSGIAIGVAKPVRIGSRSLTMSHRTGILESPTSRCRCPRSTGTKQRETNDIGRDGRKREEEIK